MFLPNNCYLLLHYQSDYVDNRKHPRVSLGADGAICHQQQQQLQIAM